MPEQDGQGETEAHTKSGTQEAKGGESMTDKELVEMAQALREWCRKHRTHKPGTVCKCPFALQDDSIYPGAVLCVIAEDFPDCWRDGVFKKLD